MGASLMLRTLVDRVWVGFISEMNYTVQSMRIYTMLVPEVSEDGVSFQGWLERGGETDG